jgi:non-ribosomal peptide synthetase component F
VNLAANLVHSASAVADGIALRLAGSRMTYRELDAASARVADLVRDRAIRPGDRVGVMLPHVIGIRRRLLRRAAWWQRGRPDEPVTEGPGGRLLPARLRRPTGAFVWRGCTSMLIESPANNRA